MTDDEPNAAVSTLEKITTFVSALLIVGLFGVLVWDVVHPNTEPALTAHPGAIAIVAGAYRAPVAVRNAGDESAKSVVVHLELVALDSVLAESDITIDWLPGNSSRDIVGLFSRPETAVKPTAVRAEVRGYATP
jgi:uncharacterized protein (TIGR02588 family)